MATVIPHLCECVDHVTLNIKNSPECPILAVVMARMPTTPLGGIPTHLVILLTMVYTTSMEDIKRLRVATRLNLFSMDLQ
jgi:hypothetical protein